MPELTTYSNHDDDLRTRLVERRARVAAVPGLAGRRELHALLGEIDAALARLDSGTFGECEVCHGRIETERIGGDPLVRVCLDCLSPGQQRALERDLELAAVVQRALLPSPHVRAGDWEIEHRYRPFGPVSGDYCDVLPSSSPGEAVHFVLGDVSGKGVSASILMSHLHGVFRSLISRNLTLPELLRHANRIFFEGTRENAFSTLLLGRLHADGGVELCNAGHVPPLLIHGETVTAIPATGMPLGVFSDGEYSTVRHELGSGDALLLYTDGLSEAVDRSGEAFGEARIEEFAGGVSAEPSGDVLVRCLDGLDVFRSGTPLNDDLTLMLVRRIA